MSDATKSATGRQRRNAAAVDPLVGEVLPTPRRIRLRNIEEIARELRVLYNLWRRGELPSGEATRGAYLLQVLAKILETSALEQRIEQLENRADELSQRTTARS